MKPFERTGRSGRHFGPALAAAFIGIVASFAAWFVLSEWEKRYAESEFSDIAADQALVLQNGLKEYLGKMIAVRAMFSASDEVSRKEFGIFADTLLHDQTAILGFSWIPHIRREDRKRHELAAVDDGLSDYQIKAVSSGGGLIISPVQDDYFPVFYSNAIGKGSVIYGLDMNSEVGRRAVLARARDGDLMATSPQIKLLSGNRTQDGFFVLMPVYRQGFPHDTVEDRRRNLAGYVNGVFATGVMFDTILRSAATPTDLFLFPQDTTPNAVSIHFLGSSLQKTNQTSKTYGVLAAGPHRSSEIWVGDARWTLVAVPGDGRFTSPRFGRAWIVLIAGLLITGVLVAYVWISGRYARHLFELAQTDSLTTLANRRAFYDRLALEFAASKRGTSPFAVLYLDLDNFKVINDTLGHAAGDELLRNVVARLRECVRDTDLVARFGGDEFAILQMGVTDPAIAGTLAARIIRSLAIPYTISGNELRVTASVGIAFYSDRMEGPDVIIMQADIALYRAKDDGRNSFRIFDLEMGQEVIERTTLEMELRDALGAGELEVYYQPIVSIATRRIVAMEALVRWHHPKLGMISPDRFISLAEKAGLINPLGDFVLRQACSDAVKWPQIVKVAVNMSPVQFQNPHLANNVARILIETKFSPERLELEITESVLLQRSENNINALYELRKLGVSIALDDFGTGFSSLSYLRMFPFDKIKIDRSFVSDVSQMDVCAAIVCAVANLGRSLDIITTAEGVETEEQFELLRAAGCTQAQGYLFGRPCSVADLNFDTKDLDWAPAKPSAALSAREIMLVRTSFSLVVPIQVAVASLFYDRLFAVAPELRCLFADDLSNQKNKLMALLSTCVGRLQDFATLAPLIRALGARHVTYGAKTEHYAIVGDALTWALREALGDAFTPEIRYAWTKVYEILAATMQAGAAEAGALRTAS